MTEKEQREYNEQMYLVELLAEGEFSTEKMLQVVDPENDIIKTRIRGLLEEMKNQKIIITKDNFKIIKQFLDASAKGIYKNENVNALFNKLAAIEIKKYTETNEKEYLQSVIDTFI